MTTDDWARLIYLGLLAVAVSGGLWVLLRRDPGRALVQAALWALIFLGVVAVHGLWGDIGARLLPAQSFRAQVGGAQGDGSRPGGRIEVPVARDGHYYLTLRLNGVPVRFVVDTGASDIVLSRTDAARIGLDPAGLAYVGRAETANGRIATAPVRLKTVSLEGIEDRNLRASVTDGPLGGSLLGMSYLSRFASLEIRGDRLILTR